MFYSSCVKKINIYKFSLINRNFSNEKTLSRGEKILFHKKMQRIMKIRIFLLECVIDFLVYCAITQLSIYLIEIYCATTFNRNAHMFIALQWNTFWLSEIEKSEIEIKLTFEVLVKITGFRPLLKSSPSRNELCVCTVQISMHMLLRRVSCQFQQCCSTLEVRCSESDQLFYSL